MHKVLVCGGREFDNYKLLRDTLDKVVGDEQCVIVSGMARGADFLGVRYANEMGDLVEEYPADWNKHGRAAGPIRNQQMLDEGKPDLVVAFPGGKGTAHMIRIAKKAGINVIEV